MFALVLSTVVGLQSPVVKVGTCPLGWYTSGSYCIPARATSPAIIPKQQTCPLDWSTAGKYCRSTLN